VLADPRLARLLNNVIPMRIAPAGRCHADRGVDVIKTRGTERAGRSDTDPRQQVYNRHQLEVIVDAAAEHDIPVMVHAHGGRQVRLMV
jgi:imidazolonepropionase-like amidohydrolase